MTILNPLPYYSIYSQFFYKYFSYIHVYFLLWPTEFNQCLPISLELSVIACCTQPWVHSWTMIAASQDPIAESSAENTPGPSMTDCSGVPVHLWVPDCSGCVRSTGCYSTSLRLIFWIIYTNCLFFYSVPWGSSSEGGTLDCHVVSAFWDICKLHVDTVCTVCSIQTGRPCGLSERRPQTAEVGVSRSSWMCGQSLSCPLWHPTLLEGPVSDAHCIHT